MLVGRRGAVKRGRGGGKAEGMDQEGMDVGDERDWVALMMKMMGPYKSWDCVFYLSLSHGVL